MKAKPVTQEIINNLLSPTTSPCISLYMSTHRRHPENMQDPIRYKNFVKHLSESLTEKYPNAEIRSVLESFETLSDDHEFWNHTGEALCILSSPERFEVFQLEQDVDELLIVADKFHTKPLRHILQSEDRYQVLALTMNDMRFYEGNQHSLIEIELPADFPKTIEQALGAELTEKHSTVAAYGGVGGNSTSMHHGQGGKKDEVDTDSARFFRIVSGAIHDHYSKAGGLPLILAALPEHHHLFTQVNKNPLLLSEGVEINPHEISTAKLSELSWEVMRPLYETKLDTLVEKFQLAKSQGLGSDAMDDVIQAAEVGRVQTLLIEANRVVAARSRNKETGLFETTDLTQPALDDQLDDVSELVHKMGGSIVIMPKDKMPGSTGLAAIFRYS